METNEVPFSKLLSEVIDNRGKTCPTADAGIPLIATNCIRNELLYPTYENVRYVSKQTYSTWFRGHPRPGDILFVNKATPGRVCVVPDPVDFCIAQDMVAVRADPNRIYPKYLFAVLRSPIAQERIAQMHVGTLIPHFKKGDFDKLLLPVPNREVQQFIGDIYFELSAKIDLNRRMNEALEGMSRALFKSWFVDFDPVRAKAEGRDTGLPKPLADLFPDRFEQSDLGDVPEGWRLGRFGDVVEQLREQEDPQASPDALFRHFSIPAFDAGQWAQIETGESIKSLKSRVQPGAILVSKLNPEIERVWLVDVEATDRAVCSTEFLVLHARPPYARSYTYCLARSPLFRQQIEALVTGTSKSHQRAHSDSILGLAAILPSKRIVDAFDRTASPLLGRTLACRGESRILAALRDALLPKLISGELRVKDAERLTERTAG